MAFRTLLSGFDQPKDPFNAALSQMVGSRAPIMGGLQPPGGTSPGGSSYGAPAPSRITPPAYGTDTNPMAPAPAPAPTPSAGVPAPGARPDSFIPPTTPAPTPKAGGDLGATQKDPYWQSVWSGVMAGSPEEKQLNDYIAFLYSLPDYKGRNEANRAAIALYARNLKAQAGENGLHPEDLQAISKIGDEYGSMKDQLSAELAARGLSGGVVAGGLSNLAGKEGGAVGDLLANITRQARQERLARQLQQMGFDEQMIQQAVAANRQEQMNKGGFWKDLLGVVGTVGGALIPGIHIGGKGGNAAQSAMGGYTDPSGYYGGSSDWFNNPPAWMDF